MELNIDAIRAVLYYIKDNIEYDENHNRVGKQYFTKSDIIKGIVPTKDYASNDVAYSIELLLDSDYINLLEPVKRDSCGNLIMVKIRGLTMEGHEFCLQTENPTIWNAVKDRAIKTGHTGLRKIGEFSSGLALALMKDPHALDNFIEGTKHIVHMFSGM